MPVIALNPQQWNPVDALILPWSPGVTGMGAQLLGRRCRPGFPLCPQALIWSWQEGHILQVPSQVPTEGGRGNPSGTLACLARPPCPPTLYTSGSQKAAQSCCRPAIGPLTAEIPRHCHAGPAVRQLSTVGCSRQ